MKEKRGGVRVNSGRKKMLDKKEPLTIYLRPSKIKAVGSREKIRRKLYDYIELI